MSWDVPWQAIYSRQTILYTSTTAPRSKADALVAEGAIWQDSPGEVAAASEVIITIIGFPEDVEAAYLGEGGILSQAKPNAVVIDMTTSSPKLAQRIAGEAETRGIQSLDAPVSGGDLGAREARLSIMVGGEREAFDRVLPIFEVMGKNIVYQGPAGSGQHTKMANQIAIASGMLGVCEALAYAQRSGLDPEQVLASIASGAAGSWSLSNLAPRIIKEDFDPGFYVKHFVKDMRIALEEADAMGMEVPGLAAAKAAYDRLASAGGEDLGTQGLYKLYADGR